MYTTHFWDKLNLYRLKGLIIVFLILCINNTYGQKNFDINLPNYDEKWIHYGFLIGVHRSYYNLDYSEKFLSGGLDSMRSIQTPARIGFDLGFIVNLRLGKLFDLRATPLVGFYEYKLEYNYSDGTQIDQLVESTVVEIPLLVKYKSIRWNNFRVYLIGGLNPAIQASGNKDDQEERKLQTAGFNLSGEFGFGFDLYFPLFKFAPEVRFSRGLLNLLQEDKFGYSEGIGSLNTNVVTFYLLFE
jgi:hypothetical protein